mmetsp:Transcript_2635/g.4593  ORF Transcript_2635/g.4593 Transcript_2635/m.4593 type:complete len:107 (+) Transcript_2635:35-355(+)
MPVVPKKRITQYFARRRRLMFYLDHYRFLYKHRREHYSRGKYQEPMYVKDYRSPDFRFPGFWPGNFGYAQSQDQAAIESTPGDLQPIEPPDRPLLMPGHRRGGTIE